MLPVQLLSFFSFTKVLDTEETESKWEEIIIFSSVFVYSVWYYAMSYHLKYWELANPRDIPASLVCGLAMWNAEVELSVDLLGGFP